MQPIFISLSKGDNWWANLTHEQQADYIEDHPNSKFAKNARDKHVDRVGIKQADKEKYGNKIKKSWDEFSDEQKEFFTEGGHRKGSKARRSLGQVMKDKSRAFVKGLKRDVEDWKVAGTAVKTITSGKKLSKREKSALKSVAIHFGFALAPIAITGGLSAGMTSILPAMGVGLLKSTLTNSILPVTMFAAATKGDLRDDATQEQALIYLIHLMGDQMANGEISEDVWAQAAVDSPEDDMATATAEPSDSDEDEDEDTEEGEQEVFNIPMFHRAEDRIKFQVAQLPQFRRDNFGVGDDS